MQVDINFDNQNFNTDPDYNIIDWGFQQHVHDTSGYYKYLDFVLEADGQRAKMKEEEEVDGDAEDADIDPGMQGNG